MKKLIFPLFLSTIVFVGCDKIDDPTPNDFVDISGISWDDSSYVESNPTVRKIILEEYTGFLCSNCPNGAKEIHRLDSIYTSQLIPISIHATNFAKPVNVDISQPPDGILDYTEDFRTPAGNAYEIAFGVSGIPKGSVSRLNSAAMTGISQWDIDINTIKNDVPKVSIGLSTLYDDSSRTAKAVVNTEWLSSETGNYNLQIFLIEDSILGDQLDGSTHILQGYTHRHVLRKAVNGIWGSAIPSSNIGDFDTQEFAVSINPNWNKEHCIMVAFIYKDSPDYEIIQAEELHISGTH